MNNYEHEIACPDNKGIHKYLWYDYFECSNINSIHYDHKKGLVTLTLECSYDVGRTWDTLKGDQNTKKEYIREHIDTFTYELNFKGTKYFHTERIILTNDYVNGRFKDTALLRKLAQKTKKNLYHFRIQTDDGFIDIIFSDFIIRKKAGRVKYFIDPIEEIINQCIGPLALDDKKRANLNGDDFERFLAMQEFFKTNNSKLIQIARNNLQFDGYGDSCQYAAYLLGKVGDSSDIPKLLDLYLNIEEYFIRGAKND